MKFIENNTYTLQTDKGLAPYNSVEVVCTYVEDNTVWLVQYANPISSVIDSNHYKLDRKTNKLYKLNPNRKKFSRNKGHEAIKNTNGYNA